MAIPNNLPQRGYIQGLWQFEDNFNDSSANGNNLTETSGTIPFVAGKIGKAADFEAGDTEYLEITDAAQTGLDITGDFTISAWIKPESISAFMSVASKYNTATGKRCYRMSISSSGKLECYVSNDGTTYAQLSTNNTLSPGNWYHVVVVVNLSLGKIRGYINNSLDDAYADYSSAINDTDTSFCIGALYSSGSPALYFDGLIDEVIVWNKALTADEIAQVYVVTAYNYFIPQIIIF